MSLTDFTQNGFPKLNSPFVLPNRQIEIPWYRLLITLWNRSGGATGGTVIPTGTVVDWGGPASTVPGGWLVCDGTLVSRANFPDLFNAIGVTWGAGDGVSTFGLPNLVNRYRKGAGTAGATGGSNSVTLVPSQLPAHTHGITDPGHTHTVTDPGHVHTLTDPGHAHKQRVVNDPTGGTAGSAGSASADTNLEPGLTDTDPTGITLASAVTGITNATALTGIVNTDSTGNGDPINIEPSFAELVVIIKT